MAETVALTWDETAAKQARIISYYLSKHLSHRTEDVYHNFIKRNILFHDKKHPKEMGADKINAFATHLAVTGKVSASTQHLGN